MANSRDEIAATEREDSLVAMEGDRFFRAKRDLKLAQKYKRKSRVNDLFADFNKLSQIEKHNFINLIKNYIIHG